METFAGVILPAALIFLLLLLLCGVLYQVAASAIGTRRYPPPGRLVDVGGYRLHLFCSGEGSPTVVLESGIAASSLSWILVQRSVAEFTRVCSYDRAGLGWSEAAFSARTCSQIVAELDLLLRNANVPPPYVLVGHSFGGLVVRLYTYRYPDRVAGLVLVDPLLAREWSKPTAHELRTLRGGVFFSHIGACLARLGVVRLCLDLLAGGAPGIPRIFIKVFGTGAVNVLERIVGEVRKLPAEILPVVKTLWCRPKCFKSMASHLASLPRSSAEMESCDLSGEIPVIVLSSGTHGPDYRMEHERLAHSLWSGAHRVASKSGHWIQLDEPEVVIAAIREVVESARRTLD